MDSELNSADSLVMPDLSQDHESDSVLNSTGNNAPTDQSAGTGFQDSDGNFSGAMENLDDKMEIWQPATTQG